MIDRTYGHLAHRYVTTSHASQGVTVDGVQVGISTESFSATGERTAYVALTRGKKRAQVFTDDKAELVRVMSRRDNPVSATSFAEQDSQRSFGRSMPEMGRPSFGPTPPIYPVQIDRGPSVPGLELSHDR